MRAGSSSSGDASSAGGTDLRSSTSFTTDSLDVVGLDFLERGLNSWCNVKGLCTASEGCQTKEGSRVVAAPQGGYSRERIQQENISVPEMEMEDSVYFPSNESLLTHVHRSCLTLHGQTK